MRNDSGIALNRPTQWAELSADITHLKKTTKPVIHQPVHFTRIWKNTLQSRGKEHLKKLPYQISVIKFTGNSAAINFCARRSWPEEARAGHQGNLRLRYAFAFKCGNTKTVRNHLVYQLRDTNNESKDFCTRNCKTWGINKRSKIELHRWISCHKNCYCSTQGLMHFNWLITVCSSLTHF